jgi:hypothetical protein
MSEAGPPAAERARSWTMSATLFARTSPNEMRHASVMSAIARGGRLDSVFASGAAPDRAPLDGACVCDAVVDAVKVLVGLADCTAEGVNTVEGVGTVEGDETADGVDAVEVDGIDVSAGSDDGVGAEEEDNSEVAEDTGRRVATAGDEAEAIGVTVAASDAAGAAFTASVLMAVVTAAISLALPAP